MYISHIWYLGNFDDKSRMQLELQLHEFASTKPIIDRYTSLDNIS